MTQVPCRDGHADLAGLPRRQRVVGGLTEVKCMEARANKHSAGAQIIFSQTILWSLAVSQLKP